MQEMRLNLVSMAKPICRNTAPHSSQLAGTLMKVETRESAAAREMNTMEPAFLANLL